MIDVIIIYLFCFNCGMINTTSRKSYTWEVCYIMKKDENKKIFGVCKVGEKGQIVIPKDARDMFDIKTGDSILLLGDKKRGLALIKT